MWGPSPGRGAVGCGVGGARAWKGKTASGSMGTKAGIRNPRGPALWVKAGGTLGGQLRAGQTNKKTESIGRIEGKKPELPPHKHNASPMVGANGVHNGI